MLYKSQTTITTTASHKNSIFIQTRYLAVLSAIFFTAIIHHNQTMPGDYQEQASQPPAHLILSPDQAKPAHLVAHLLHLNQARSLASHSGEAPLGNKRPFGDTPIPPGSPNQSITDAEDTQDENTLKASG